jgi:hypothetical protein
MTELCVCMLFCGMPPPRVCLWDLHFSVSTPESCPASVATGRSVRPHRAEEPHNMLRKAAGVGPEAGHALQDAGVVFAMP